MISITEEIAVPSPPPRVWQVLSDPADVVSCIGGAALGEAHDDGSFDGTLVVRFGAARVGFAARVTLELTEPDFEGRLSARGRDGQRATRFTAHATFRVGAGQRPGESVVTVRGEVQLTGKLASLIESGAGAVVARMTREFSVELVRRCAEGGGVAGAGVRVAPSGVAAGVQAGPSAAEPVSGTRPVPRSGPFARLRAWWVRLLTRRQKPSAHRESAAEPLSPHTPQPQQEADHGSVQAQ
ncbi:carbon monoxide dehydrogenase subunit G [Actinobacteria bacterium OK074]|nr:carbon monoxide dehydrogenase subunit G [Actinobacteria bacterium OK074]